MTSAQSQDPPASGFALFDYGFRPFFLLAGLDAFAVVPVWLYFFAHHAVAFGALPAAYWHSHELLYGFVLAAATGTRDGAGVPHQQLRRDRRSQQATRRMTLVLLQGR